MHQAGLYGLRVADAARLRRATTSSAACTPRSARRSTRTGASSSCATIRWRSPRTCSARPACPSSWPKRRSTISHDAYIRADSDLSLERTGKDVGTPILTFHPGADDEGSFFGPVISKVLRGEQAVALWDAVELLATTPGMSELKRSNRAKLDFA